MYNYLHKIQATRKLKTKSTVLRAHQVQEKHCRYGLPEMPGPPVLCLSPPVHDVTIVASGASHVGDENKPVSSVTEGETQG